MNSELAKELQRYTKDELIYYLTKIECFISKYSSPKNIILEKRLNDVQRQVHINLSKCKNLSKNYESKTIKDVDYLFESMKLRKEWEDLKKKQDKIEKELFSSLD